ncbi:MAG: hypothetical protein Q7V17_07925 [Afipia sp.]|nr:hypothetical protein [Afipia sp.]
MQLELQHVDPHADPHDAIVAQLRELAPRIVHDPSKVHAPSEVNVTPAASPEPASEPPLHTAPLNDNVGDILNPEPRGKLARGVTGLIVCGGIAAAAVWHSYGDEAKQRLSHLVPQLLAGTTAPTQSADAAESQNTTSQITASEPAGEPAPAQDTAAAAPTPATPAESASAASTPAAETPLIQAALTPELAQSIETMTREIASLKQTVEQLQAGQQQLSRDVAKAAEHEARRKPVAQASKPAAAPRPQRASTLAPAPAPATRSVQPYPPQAYPQGQTYPQGYPQREAYIPPAPPQQPAPAQLPPPPGDTSVPRPPMPLR